MPDSSWTRIGRYDKAQRRSTWARVEYIGPLREHIVNFRDVRAVEMCAGREGSDAFVRFERGGEHGERALYDMWELVSTALYGVEDVLEECERGDDDGR